MPMPLVFITDGGSYVNLASSGGVAELNNALPPSFYRVKRDRPCIQLVSAQYIWQSFIVNDKYLSKLMSG
jgi:hypothetical protein